MANPDAACYPSPSVTRPATGGTSQKIRASPIARSFPAEGILFGRGPTLPYNRHFSANLEGYSGTQRSGNLMLLHDHTYSVIMRPRKLIHFQSQSGKGEDDATVPSSPTQPQRGNPVLNPLKSTQSCRRSIAPSEGPVSSHAYGVRISQGNPIIGSCLLLLSCRAWRLCPKLYFFDRSELFIRIPLLFLCRNALLASLRGGYLGESCRGVSKGSRAFDSAQITSASSIRSTTSRTSRVHVNSKFSAMASPKFTKPLSHRDGPLVWVDCEARSSVSGSIGPALFTSDRRRR